jgi:phospholipid N-methyltransferase
MLLLKELWHNPKTVGAVWPSSDRLAKKMAAQISPKHPGFVIEIGAGTGAITKALLARGILPTHLIVIEQSANLVDHLHEMFPEVVIIKGDAAHLRQILPAAVNQINAIVSSLPLRSLPNEQVSVILNELHALLPPESKLIQFTYDLFSKEERYMEGFRLIKSFSVWLNIPSAKVQVFVKNVKSIQ